MTLTPEQWNEVKELFDAALAQPALERSSFLRRVCSEDAIIREAERLLAYHTEGGELPFGVLQNVPPIGQAKEQSFSPGEVLASRFKVIQFLARGGMGEVYQAEDLELHEQVALKTIRPEILSDPHALDRFKREVHLAKQVTHPNICRIFDLFRHATSADTSIVLVSMELLRGETLATHLERVGKMTAIEATPIALQMANGLGAAHELGILHRDFKPGNVVLIPGAKGIRVAITDFGLALQPGDDSSQNVKLTTGGQMGTPAYMSPEQVEGRELTPASDVYSLGLVLYEMVTGARPFDDPTPLTMAVRRLKETPASPRTLAPDLDEKWDKLILRCVERDITRRFATADEVSKAIKGETSIAIPKPRPRARLAWSLVVIAVILIGLGGLYHRSYKNKRLTDKDTIVLADFANTTGDAVFDDTLKTALAVSLRQSPFLSVLSEGRVAGTLKLMTLPHGTKLTPDVTREVCQRAGSKAYIAGSIAGLGSQYVITLKAVNCQNGDTLAQEIATAASKEKVLDSLGDEVSKLRAELGESLTSVQKFDVPLAEATTSSLEALKAFSQGGKAFVAEGEAAALPLHQRAIELDPNFAIAYRSVGADYFGLGELGRASEYYTKAFQLRDRAGEREKLYIAAGYYTTATGQLDKALQVYEQEMRDFPRDPGFTGLYNEVGQHEKAIEAGRRSLRLIPDSAIPYGNLALAYLALQRFDDAQQLIQQAEAKKLVDFVVRESIYALAFLHRDAAAMAEQMQWFAGKPEENNALSLASDTEAHSGHLKKASEITRQAVDSAIRADSKETGAIWWENSAIREAAFGNLTEAKQAADKGLKLAPESLAVGAEAALAFAMARETERAQSLAQDLNRRHPLDTQLQSLWLPAIDAQLSLNEKNSTKALTDLQISSTIEFAIIPFLANLNCLYPTYVRGEAYLTAGDGPAAAAEFRKVLDHSGLAWSCWTEALAHLGIARANALQARTSQGAEADAARVRAQNAYKDFLALWKDADPNIPLLKQARAEYAKLQ
jgi:eukaryotic-like serine/threonine-protein kinase